jgi:hypothetical protein
VGVDAHRMGEVCRCVGIHWRSLGLCG